MTTENVNPVAAQPEVSPEVAAVAQQIILDHGVPAAANSIPLAGNYPASARDTIMEMTYPMNVINAVAEFRDKKAWRGTVPERKEKFLFLHEKLCACAGITATLNFRGLDLDTETPTGNGYFDPQANAITLVNKLSVITYLHEFAHAVWGSDERIAVVWSLNLFRIMFPLSFQNLAFVGHMAMSRSTVGSMAMRTINAPQAEPEVAEDTSVQRTGSDGNE